MDDSERPDIAAFVALSNFTMSTLRDWSEEAVEAFLDAERAIHPWEHDGFLAYLLHGYRDPEGRRAIDIFLDDRSASLSAEQLRALQRLQQAWPSLFQIEQVERDVGFVARDLLTGERIDVSERLGTHTMERGMVMLAWLKPMEDHTQLEAPTIVPPAHVPTVCTALARALESAQRTMPISSRRERLAAALPTAYRTLRQAVRTWVPPTPRTDDGQELARYEAVYEAPDPAAVRRALQSMAGVTCGDNDTFALPCEPVTINGVVAPHTAMAELRTVRLTVTAPTARALAEARKLVERTLGKRIRHRFDETVPFAEMVEYASRQKDEEQAEMQTETRTDVPVRGVQGTRHDIPLMAHEVMGRIVPNLAHDVAAFARSFRTRSGWEKRAVQREDILDSEIAEQIFRNHALRLVREGHDRDYAIEDANYLASHFFYMANHEAHLRKTFFVDEAMAWMLANTALDVEGAMLKLPFPSCAFVFTDPYTLELAASLLRDVRDISTSRKSPTIMTAYLIDGPPVQGGRALYAYLLFDAQTGHWPYMVNRDLIVRDGDDLEGVVESKFDDLDTPDRDPLFETPELKKLLHLVVCAVLYATSAHAETIKLVTGAGHSKKKKNRQPKKADVLLARSGDDVFHLPGTIDIGRVRMMRDLARTGEGRTILKRFMVRGHWRRAPKGWKDPRPRWIEPHWKGPEVAAIIERKYRLKDTTGD